MSQILVPNLSALIVPNTSAAGFSLGLTLRDFLKQVEFVEITEKESYQVVSEAKCWRIHYQDYRSGFDWDRRHFKNIFAYWSDSVVLQFNGDDEQRQLNLIMVGGSYKGKVFGILGIGDRLDLVANNYDLLFHADVHYLAVKKDVEYDADFRGFDMNQSWEDRELVKGLEITTDYRAIYSLEYPNQIVEKIIVF